MSYPNDKETFRRVVGEDLSQGIPGDVIKAEDHNAPVDLLERLQDILGLNPQGSYESVASRLSALSSRFVFDKYFFVGPHNITYSETSWNGIIFKSDLSITETQSFIVRTFLVFRSGVANGHMDFSINYKFNDGSWSLLNRVVIMDAEKPNYDYFYSFISEKKLIGSAGNVSLRYAAGNIVGYGNLVNIYSEIMVL